MPHFHVTLDRGDEYSVSFTHIRPTTTARDIGAFDAVQVAGMRDASNGATICNIYSIEHVGFEGTNEVDMEVSLAASDAAICSPSDNFSRRAGRKLSFARALQTFPRHQRAAFWRQFHLHEKGGEAYAIERE